MQHPVHGWAMPGKIVRVVDGDTIDVERTIKFRIRLLDCYAPEGKNHPSAIHLRSIAEGKDCTILIPTEHERSLTDILTLDRVLGYAWIKESDLDLSSLQVQNGYATTNKIGK